MNLSSIITTQKDYFNTNITKNIKFRKEKLKLLYRILSENEERILEALKKDLNKSPFEAYASEYNLVMSEIVHYLKNISRWGKPKTVRTPLTLFPGATKVYREPFGSVAILAPWNYPLMLALCPAVGAMAAGNCLVIKSSKSSFHTSSVICELINNNFESKYIYCVPIDTEYDEITSQAYDFIFFTGSENIGKQIMKKASENLIPVVLELGGKSPCIIDETADLSITIPRLIWGKAFNSGQTCVAPDYLLVHKNIKEKFLTKTKEYIQKHYSNSLTDPAYAHIINKRHFTKLQKIVDEHKGDKIGGSYDCENFVMQPTLLCDCNWDSPSMSDEIFGPIFPVIEYENMDEIVTIIKNRKKPLAFYIFSRNIKRSKQIIKEISFGCGAINDVTMQVANNHSPFGGVGASGMGSYHGKYGFNTFSRPKGVLRTFKFMDIKFRFQNFNTVNMKIMKLLFKIANRL